MQTIIKWTIYEYGDMLLRPIFSWYYSIVDCIQYLKKTDVIDKYSKEKIKEIIKESLKLTYDGEKYYECEVGPICTDGMKLLSIVKDYYDEETEF